MTSLTYIDLERMLASVDSDVEASACHGYLCGQICRTGSAVEELWREFLQLHGSEDDVVENCREEIRSLVLVIRDQLSSLEMEFALLLPDDHRDVEERVEGLALWCRGFVLGFETSHPDPEEAIGAQCTEILDDVRMISRAGVDEKIDDDEERMLTELVEYVRVGAILMFEDLNFARQAMSPEVLH